ncbi:hypothetical protein LOD99_4700 [Oopsacas minuta]|uniref:Uncharacterized protein n=1 Tax=Oopsacas minuta TaxID=111878 RepID=A0AAV7JTU8_9METZ|nr:hypothetical protein LOD99_4700 [Oopsacas minuta]
MISSDHGTAEITHFLNKWVLTCKAVLHKDLKIEHIEMDHSWAIMHSTCLAFNRLSMSLYLAQCWEIVNNKTTTKSDIPTVLHLCSAHILHRISCRLDRINKLDKKVKRLVLHSFGTMVKSSNIEEISLVFESLCILLTTELRLPQVIKSLVDLEKLVKGNFESKCSENFYIDDYPENAEGNTYRKTSPFGRYFEECYSNAIVKFPERKQLVPNQNGCYCPEILEYILTYYMPLLPLWSGIILSKVNINAISTDSNAEVENWFKIVKHCIFKSQNNIRVGDFMRCLFTYIRDRLASFEFAFQPLGHKVFKVKENCERLLRRRNLEKFGEKEEKQK